MAGSTEAGGGGDGHEPRALGRDRATRQRHRHSHCGSARRRPPTNSAVSGGEVSLSLGRTSDRKHCHILPRNLFLRFRRSPAVHCARRRRAGRPPDKQDPSADRRSTGVPVNDPLTRPIGVLGSRHEFAPRYHGKNFLPSPKRPAHSSPVRRFWSASVCGVWSSGGWCGGFVCCRGVDGWHDVGQVVQ